MSFSNELIMVDKRKIKQAANLVPNSKSTNETLSRLDPNKSHLYFQGWIVHLQPQDRFIQFNPKELINPAN